MQTKLSKKQINNLSLMDANRIVKEAGMSKMIKFDTPDADIKAWARNYLRSGKTNMESIVAKTKY